MSSIWIPKWSFGFIRTGGGGKGGMCGSTMRRRGGGGGKMCRSSMRRNLYKLTKIFNEVFIRNISKTV